MDAFFCITLSIIVIRYWWKNRPVRYEPPKQKPLEEFDFSRLKHAEKVTIERKQKKEAEKQREKEIAELKRQGYTDELIATILPTIDNDGG